MQQVQPGQGVEPLLLLVRPAIAPVPPGSSAPMLDRLTTRRTPDAAIAAPPAKTRGLIELAKTRLRGSVR